jgi:hypothetical protein
VRTKRKQRMFFRKHNDNRLGEFEITVRDAYYHKKLDLEVGDLDSSLKRILGRLDEKYNIAWNKVLPERFLDKNFKKRK